MSHYYEYDPSLDGRLIPISFTLNDERFDLNSAAGIFSSDKFDTGSRILVETLLEDAAPGRNVLDLGCGIGVIGVILSRFWHCAITGIDPNTKACELAEANYKANHVEGVVLCQDHLDDKLYDTIVLNPPIRTGKETIYRLFDECEKQLTAGGSLWIVIRKQHGAQSALDRLQAIGLQARRVARDKGFWVIQAIKPE